MLGPDVAGKIADLADVDEIQLSSALKKEREETLNIHQSSLRWSVILTIITRSLKQTRSLAPK